MPKLSIRYVKNKTLSNVVPSVKHVYEIHAVELRSLSISQKGSKHFYQVKEAVMPTYFLLSLNSCTYVDHDL